MEGIIAWRCDERIAQGSEMEFRGVRSQKEFGNEGNNVLKGELLATPAIANGAIFLRTDKHLYCIGTKK